jgi:hypothetical protein
MRNSQRGSGNVVELTRTLSSVFAANSVYIRCQGLAKIVRSACDEVRA